MGKRAIYADREIAKMLKSKGSKTVSHSSFTAKRHPTSKRVK